MSLVIFMFGRSLRQESSLEQRCRHLGGLQAWGCWQVTFGTGYDIARGLAAFCRLVLLTTMSVSSEQGSVVSCIPCNRWTNVQGCARQGAELWMRVVNRAEGWQSRRSYGICSDGSF
jgi:hypothetical protein